MSPSNHPMPRSLWAATAPPGPSLDLHRGETTADCAIVGGGFTGLSCALHLAERGARVVVLEAKDPGWGASGRNGGQVIAGLKFDPDELEALLGPERGRRLVALAGGTADRVFDLIDRHEIACEAHRGGWIQAAGAERSLPALHERARQWAERRAPARVLDRDEIRRLTGTQLYVGGWIDPRGGQINPLAFARGLAAAAIRAGAIVHRESPAVALERVTQGPGNSWRVRTAGGSVVAGNVVLATNGYTDRLWPGLAETVVPVVSSIVATEPLSDNLRALVLPGRQNVSDTRRLLSYYGIDGHGRLVYGGRARQREEAEIATFAPLIGRMKAAYPMLGEPRIAYHWAGRVAVTLDAMPHLHELAPGLFAGLGYNGRGVAMATTMGALLAERVSGARAEDIPLPTSAPRRIPFHRLRRTAVAAAIAWKWMQDRYAPT